MRASRSPFNGPEGQACYMLFNDANEAFAAVCVASRDLETYTWRARLRYVSTGNKIETLPFAVREWPPTDDDVRRAKVVIQLHGGDI